MQEEKFRELKHRDFLYNTKRCELISVSTPPNKFEVDKSKLKVGVTIIASKETEKLGKQIDLKFEDHSEWEPILSAINNVEDPSLYASLMYTAMVVDSITMLINQGAAASRPQLKI